MRSSVIPTARTFAQCSLAIAIAFAAPITTSAQNGGDAPRPVVGPKPGTSSYKVLVEAGGRTLIMDVVCTVKDLNGSWVVTETSTMPGMTMTDEGTIEKKTLLLRKRVIRGPDVADLQFVGSRATGTITIKGQAYPIDKDMGGAIFADGPGGQDVIAALPLAHAYTTSFRNFDVLSQQVEVVQLRVMGTDTVSVPAGTFHTWKVLITSADGAYPQTGAIWVDKRSRRVVKMASTVPQIRGAIGTAELIR